MHAIHSILDQWNTTRRKVSQVMLLPKKRPIKGNMIREIGCMLVLAAFMFAGCCQGSANSTTSGTSILNFETPNILLHTYESPELTPIAKESGIAVKESGRIGVYKQHIITGCGSISYGIRRIVVSDNAICIDGTTITNFAERGARNAILMKDGTIKLDAFVPFEDPRYHPTKP